MSHGQRDFSQRRFSVAESEADMDQDLDIEHSNGEHPVRDVDHVPEIPTALNIAYIGLWVVALALFAYYVSVIWTEFEESKEHPRSVLKHVHMESQVYPKTTICNWNNYRTPSCDECDLIPLECQMMNGGHEPKDCSEHFERKVYPTRAGHFVCYEFNEYKNLSAHGTGYSHSIVTTWAMPRITNVTLDKIWTRLGLQVTFSAHEAKVDPYEETNFAAPGQDTIYLVEEFKSPSYGEHDHPATEPERRYEHVATFVELAEPASNATHVVAGITIGFRHNYIIEMEYSPEYKLENFFGDFAGILGLLTGLDTIKVMTSVPLFIEAIKHRTVFHLREHFL